MRDRWPSLTAAFVSAARGLASVDPLAAEMLPAPLAAALRAAERAPWMTTAANVFGLGLVDHLELRTRAIDAAVIDASPSQLVVLGAGLDTRAWRMPELASAIVFEVDHPATQSYKRARVESRVALAREVRFVSVDFEKERFADRLAAAGHRADERTFWIWEGVIPYLAREALRESLAQIAERSHEASKLAATYGTPEGAAIGVGGARFAHAMFRAIGEPLRGLVSPSAIAEELDAVGLRIESDTSPRDWARIHGGDKRRIFFIEERLALATKN